MIKKYRENITFRHIFWMTLVYILAHGFLLIVTGRWWDDWVYANKNWDYLYEVMRQSSLPLIAYFDASTWLFPDGFYRVIVFAIYYAGALFCYQGLRMMEFLSEKESFFITLLYLVIPVNDARIAWICYPYSLGLFFFWIAFYLSLLWNRLEGKKRIAVRVAALLTLLLAYTGLEPTMMFTIPLLLYFYYLDVKEIWNGRQTSWKMFVRNLAISVGKHMDYLLAPIVSYFGSKLLFPGYGYYGGHSYVPWSALPEIVVKSPWYALITLKKILGNFILLLKNHYALPLIVLIIAAYLVICYFSRDKKKECSEEPHPFAHHVIMMVIGAFVFFLGFFPYAVKRNSAIPSTYTDGRDTILLGIGTAILLYYGICILFRGRIRQLILIVFVSLGMIHFNFKYFDWQECYYQQLQIRDEIAENTDILENDTFLVMYGGEPIFTFFFQTNGNSWAATGEETRFYMNGVNDLTYLVTDNEKTRWILNAFGMNQYEYGDRTIDGIIFVDYDNISRGTLIKQKFNEFFRQEKFKAWIHEIKHIQYAAITPEESDELLQMFTDGTLTEDVIYDKYYKE